MKLAVTVLAVPARLNAMVCVPRDGTVQVGPLLRNAMVLVLLVDGGMMVPQVQIVMVYAQQDGLAQLAHILARNSVMALVPRAGKSIRFSHICLSSDLNLSFAQFFSYVRANAFFHRNGAFNCYLC